MRFEVPPRRRQYQRTRQAYAHSRGANGDGNGANPLLAQLVHILPFIILLVFAMLGSPSFSEEPFKYG